MSSDHDNHDPNSIELPTPTAWPIVAAFGLSLIFFGMVTNLIITVVGVLVGLMGAIGWFKDVFPHPQHVPVPIEKGPEEIKTTGRKVMMFYEGAADREYVAGPVHPYSAGFVGGLVGAFFMAVIALAYGLFVQGSIWYPINLLGAVGAPSMATADIATLKQFSLLGLVVGTISHLSISIMVGLLYVIILPMLPSKKEWIWGGILAPILWSGVMATCMQYISPIFAERISWLWFVASQIAFGLAAGFVISKTYKVSAMQQLPISARLGVEAQHRGEGKH